MTAAAQPPEPPSSSSGRSPQNSPKGTPSKKFFVGLLAIFLAVLVVGVGGFGYLKSRSSLALLSGSDRQLAAATAFVPAESPLTLSLLTSPEQLLALQQGLAAPPQRQQVRDEVERAKEALLDATGLSYDRDIQPWLGEEVTFSLTDLDLDLDDRNGRQPGYLLALEIAPGQQAQAKEALQLFWQRQSLAGNAPQTEQASGVRLLHASGDRDRHLKAASALVGDQFVMLANDVRVLRRSIRATQAAANLAQSRTYRRAVEQLPAQRLGLAYVSQSLVAPNEGTPRKAPLAIGLAATRRGLVAHTLLPNAPAKAASAVSDEPGLGLGFLPMSSVLALSGTDLSNLEPRLLAVGVTAESLPTFLSLAREPSSASLNPGNSVAPRTAQAWAWANGDYAVGQTSLGRDPDWLLAVERQPAGVEALDKAAQLAGYSVVPVAIGDVEATAWSRFQMANRGRSSGNNLRTDILGLHLQQDDYEVFASSLKAMERALQVSASRQSLLNAAAFNEAIAPLPSPNQGYLYFDWLALTPDIARFIQGINEVKPVAAMARSLGAHLQTVAATQQGDEVTIDLTLSAQKGVLLGNGLPSQGAYRPPTNGFVDSRPANLSAPLTAQTQ